MQNLLILSIGLLLVLLFVVNLVNVSQTFKSAFKVYSFFVLALVLVKVLDNCIVGGIINLF